MSSNDFSNDDRIVKTVRVVVHTAGAWPNGMSDNHWSLYLLLDQSISVRMNMTAELEDPTGHLRWTSNSYTLTSSAIKHWDYQTMPNVSVANIYQLVVTTSHRDKYEMSGGGSGCRWWIYTIIADLQRQHLASKNAASLLWPELLFQYSKTTSRKQLPMVKGTFAHTNLAASSSSQTRTSAVTWVKLQPYQSGGKACFSWEVNGEKGYSYAVDWTPREDSKGNPCLCNLAKNLWAPKPI